MPSFVAEYTTNDLVEVEAENGETENRFGWVRGVSFRRVEGSNHVATYTIHLCNKGEVIHEVTDGEILRRYTVDERKRT